MGSSTQCQWVHWGKTARVHSPSCVLGTNTWPGVNLSTLQLQTPSLPAQRPTQLPLMGNQPNIAANTPVVHIKEEQQAQWTSIASIHTAGTSELWHFWEEQWLLEHLQPGGQFLWSMLPVPAAQGPLQQTPHSNAVISTLETSNFCFCLLLLLPSDADSAQDAANPSHRNRTKPRKFPPSSPVAQISASPLKSPPCVLIKTSVHKPQNKHYLLSQQEHTKWSWKHLSSTGNTWYQKINK